MTLLTELNCETRQLCPYFSPSVSDSSIESFDRQRRRVVFVRGQTAERVRNFLSRQLHRIFDLHSFDHLSEHRTAGQRRRATVGEEARSFDATIAKPQAQTQTIAADWVCLFRNSIRVG